MNEDWLSKCIGDIDNAYITEAEGFSETGKRRSYWKTIGIKWTIILLGVGILLTLLLKWPPREYRLVKEDGYYYMYIDPKYSDSFVCDCKNELHMDVYFAWKYDSLDAMESEIRNGTFTASEFYRLGRHMDEKGRVRIFDLDNMKDAVFPEGLSHYIEFFPHKYFICGESKTGTERVSMAEISEENFRKALAKYSNFTKAKQITDWSSVGKDPRENAPVFQVHGQSYCYYVLVTDYGRYYVRELIQELDEASNLFAYQIFGQAEDGTFFELTIQDLQKRPSLDWLSAFRLVDREYQ